MATASKFISMGTKIVAVGRNYAAHAKELGNAVPKEPVLFMKPTSSYLPSGGNIEIPHPLESLDHEVELAVVIGQKARDVSEATAMDYVGGYALALDMTAREIQSSAKSAGLPWTVAKGQDTFTPISSFVRNIFYHFAVFTKSEIWMMSFTYLLALPYSRNVCQLNIWDIAFMFSTDLDLYQFSYTFNSLQLSKSLVPDPDNLEIWLKIDGEYKQKGFTRDMIFKLPFLISHISSIMTLFEGDVILTGTPQGVGPVKAGQNITAGITGLIDVNFGVQKRQRPGRC
ncbi:hypothetical protein IFM89_017466 [Coptis chinensis]|uniref:Fumarylacetoacetase-like C-terminal domain-containing protein n=1 Tax=Coptis chinensis TaxID=261450 RepID=A0A835HW22_9MAGN|nr:hypothetical protein IFM89_017466 [Coptis chinensis]